MNIDVLLTPMEIEPDRVSGRVVIVIDVFRATSCICTAIASGAKGVVPATTIEQAMSLKADLCSAHRVLLGGERFTRKIDGFDLDNSPLSYDRDMVEGAMIVMSTTNGTRALNGALAAGAQRVVVGALVNAKAVAKAVGQMGLDVAILCAGRKDHYTMEDALAAGMIASLIQAEHTATLSDIAYTMIDFYDRHKDDLRAVLRHCAHYNHVMDGGLADDVAYCLSTDLLDVVPQFDNGCITSFAPIC